MTISPARIAAFDILLRIEVDQAYSSVLLPMFEAGLSAIDRGLCHELTLGTLRRQIYLDKLIEKFSSGRKLDIQIRIAIRLGLYQLLFLDRVPDYSAINESVNLVQRAQKTSAKGFVNAILRRASREVVELSFVDGVERLSVETSHPRWLIERWINEFGIETTSALANANNEVPATACRMTGESTPFSQDVVKTASPSRYVEGCFLFDANDRRIFELAERGDVYIQDEASQMVAQAVHIPPKGKFLDVCAAPGGKTGAIARRYLHTSNLFAAGDLHGARVEYLLDNCRRQGAETVQVVRYDAEERLPFQDMSFASVLVDAPCSGTGTIRHNPELRYFLKSGDFAELASKQLAILNNASKLVGHEGTLVYSTCSVEREENEGVCADFLAANGDFHIVRPEIDDRFITADGFARTWPQRDSMDGFFIAAFRRLQA